MTTGLPALESTGTCPGCGHLVWSGGPPTEGEFPLTCRWCETVVPRPGAVLPVEATTSSTTTVDLLRVTDLILAADVPPTPENVALAPLESADAEIAMPDTPSEEVKPPARPAPRRAARRRAH